MHVSTASLKCKQILKHLFIHQSFQKYVAFKQPYRKKERVFLNFTAETENKQTTILWSSFNEAWTSCMLSYNWQVALVTAVGRRVVN